MKPPIFSVLLVVSAMSGSPASAQPSSVSITSCSLRRTGFLGIGAGREAEVGLVNLGSTARAFTVRIYALYPGSGRELVAVSAIAAPAGSPTSARVRFRARHGMTNIMCEVDR